MTENGISFNTKISLRTNNYITGSVTDIIFAVCEIIFKIARVTTNKTINFITTEDKVKWLFEIHNPYISKIDNNSMYILKNVVVSIPKSEMEILPDKIIISMSKA